MAQTLLCVNSKVAQFRKAEKDDSGMALKIFMGAKPFLKAFINHLVITETRMLTALI
jgi:hypothetical protein